jgi:hypothetical protein
LDPIKINAILRYLERSKSLEIDLDGNIIWIREEKAKHSTLADVANISTCKGEDTEENDKVNKC